VWLFAAVGSWGPFSNFSSLAPGIFDRWRRCNNGAIAILLTVAKRDQQGIDRGLDMLQGFYDFGYPLAGHVLKIARLENPWSPSR